MPRSLSRRCATMSVSANTRWDCCGVRRWCRKATAGRRKRRSTGMKPGSTSAMSGPRCRSLPCARWPAGRRSTAPIGMRRSRRSWKRTSTPSPISAGCFHRLRYDNLASAVRKILRGHRREETVRFLAFRSHWRFAAEFCTPGAGHEKGGVEGEGGYFRRNHLVPVPRVADLDALNAMLLTACRADEARVLDGRSETIGAAMAIERGHLLPCAVEGLDLAETVFPVVDKQSCVTVKTNFYSVPARAGSRVEARVHPLHIEIWQAARLIARHERCHSRRQHVLDLEHYLDVLGHKPGAFAGSKLKLPLIFGRDGNRLSSSDLRRGWLFCPWPPIVLSPLGQSVRQIRPEWGSPTFV